VIAVWMGLALGGEVVVWHSWRGAESAALEEAATAWEARSGDDVRLVEVPFGAFGSKVETAIPRGNGPDLFIAGHDNLGKWAQMGLLAPATGPTDGFRPVTVEALRRDGEVWGTPLAFKSLLLLYDPTRVASPPTTVDALVALAKAETAGDRFGLAWQAAEPYFFAPFLHAFGGATVAADGTVTLDDAAHERAFALVKRLAVDEQIAPGQPTGELITRLYAEGKATFVISGPWFTADAGRPIAAAPLPSVDGAPLRPFLTVDAAFVPSPARNATGGSAFAAFLAGPEGAEIRDRVGHQAVASLAVTPTDPLVQALVAQAENAVPMPTDPRLGSVFEAQARALRGLLRGARDAVGAGATARQYYEVVTRPPPPPVSPTPYLAVVLAGLGVLAAFVVANLRDPIVQDRLSRHKADYLWIAPAGLAVGTLVFIPFVTGAAVSLFDYHGGTWSFVGLSHFVDIILSRGWPIASPLSFYYTLVVTLLWTVSNLVLHVAIGVALALMLREPWIKARPVWRALLILPWAIPNYITALIWKGMFHAQFGAINAVLSALTGEPVALDWFARFSTAFAANLATNTWLGFPFMMVITLGALQSVSRDLEEAAEIDGASWWFRFRHVVWPLLAPALLPAVLLGSVWTFNMFNVIYLVSAGEPDGSTEILISEAYRWAFSRGNRYGYASAYAVIIFFVLLAYSRVANRLAGRRVL
jgi:arabinogalactan oligomer/maltooligosaccharide transport system permease protein